MGVSLLCLLWISASHHCRPREATGDGSVVGSFLPTWRTTLNIWFQLIVDNWRMSQWMGALCLCLFFSFSALQINNFRRSGALLRVAWHFPKVFQLRENSLMLRSVEFIPCMHLTLTQAEYIYLLKLIYNGGRQYISILRKLNTTPV